MNTNFSKCPAFQRRLYSPFDPSAGGRLQRMGLLREDGSADREAVAVLCRVYAGLFYDSLYDVSQNAAAVRGILHQMAEASAGADPKRRFLVICLQYDAIHKPLPDPVWWMSGSLELADLFSAGFLAQLQKFIGEEGDPPCQNC